MKWVTRENANVDRVACPWLIKRFIDPEAAPWLSTQIGATAPRWDTVTTPLVQAKEES